MKRSFFTILVVLATTVTADDLNVCNFTVTNWFQWSTCSKSCGIGTKYRFRSCIPDGSKCNIALEEKIVCSDSISCEPTDFVKRLYSYFRCNKWSQWSSCSALSSEIGLKNRTRLCLMKPPAIGSYYDRQFALCHILHPLCPPFNKFIPNYVETSWLPWSGCSNSCGTGIRSRYKKCWVGGGSCDRNLKEVEECISYQGCTSQTPVWGSWSSCSVTIGFGIRERSSIIEYSVPARKQVEECEADNWDYQLEYDVTNWYPWSTCKYDYRYRFRKCIPQPSNCSVPLKESEFCGLLPVIPPNSSGGKSGWSSWSRCSAVCRPLISTRTRIFLCNDSFCRPTVETEVCQTFNECIIRPLT